MLEAKLGNNSLTIFMVGQKGPPVHSTSWKFNLHIVDIFKRAWDFLTKFLHSDQMLSINIFTPLYSKCEVSAYAQLAITLTYYWQISWHGISWKFTLSILLDKWDQKLTSWMWSRDTSGNSYNISNFLVEMLTYKQTIILTFGRNKFSKRTLQNLETRAHF